MGYLRARVLGTAALLLLSAAPVWAATFTVNSTLDAQDAAPGNGVCETGLGNGVCTLRAAIQEANALAGADVINVPAGTYTLMIPNQFTFSDSEGNLDLRGSVTIVGAGAATTIIQACTVHQKTAPCPAGQGIAGNVFTLVPVFPRARIEISGVTIRNGGFVDGSGGGLDNLGNTLVLTDVVVQDNMSALGGGIYSLVTEADQSQTLTRVTLSGNVATRFDGGGLLAFGTAAIVDSVASGNIAGRHGGGIHVGGFATTTVLSGLVVTGNQASSGAGVFVDSGGSTTLERSTVSGNTATGDAGGVLVSAHLTMIDSTISGNTAGNNSGGLQHVNNFALTMRNSTISGNSAGRDCGGVGGFAFAGGSSLNNVTITENTALGDTGGYCAAGGIPLVSNTIIGGNRDLGTAQTIPDCRGLFTSRGFNVIGNPASCLGFQHEVNGDQVGTVDAALPVRLAPLADNGGPTLTHAPLVGSPAVGRGSLATPGSGAPACETTDQRGTARPQPAGGRCDVGAFEGVASTDNPLAVTFIRPARAGNTAPVIVLMYGGFPLGTTARLSRAGQPEILGEGVTIHESLGVLAALFDITGTSPGAWDVTVSSPDGATVTREQAFLVEQGGGPELWADIVGPQRIGIGRPVRYRLFVGNRGNVDAFGVPFGVSAPVAHMPSLKFNVLPPPPRAGQVPTDWAQVPITAAITGRGDIASIPMLFPVVPAGFVGVFEFTITAPDTRAFELTTGIGTPYFRPELNPQVVSAFLQGAQAYAARSFGTPPHPPDPTVQAYITAQLESVVSLGTDGLLSNVGTGLPVYSLSQLLIDVARFGAVLLEAQP